MTSKDLMRSLSTRLEPIREEFRLRLYSWSLGILEQQASNDDSLFWRLPNRKITNLKRLLKINDEDRSRFILILHGCHHRSVFSRLGQSVPPHEEELALMERCISPTELDVKQGGLLPFETPIPRLNKRDLNAAIRARLRPRFEENIDPALPNERCFEIRKDSWRIIVSVDTRAPYAQVELEFDIRLGMGDLSLDRQLSLHGLFGISNTACDLAKPGEEEEIAQLIDEHCRFMVPALSGLLEGLDPGISREEVARAEEEWKQWLKEVRANRAGRQSER